MTFVGIDFSINSPSVCISNNGKLSFMSFFNTNGDDWNRANPLKKYTYHNELNGIVKMVPYERNNYAPSEKYSDYSIEQMSKMQDAVLIADLITKEIETNTDDLPKIAIEGFAYGSKGMSFIDLILFNSFLRKNIVERFGVENLIVIAPKEAKKFAGNGNADKEYMINEFIKNPYNDEELDTSKFYRYMANISIDYKNIKPVDDLVDAYWIMKTAKEKYFGK